MYIEVRFKKNSGVVCIPNVAKFDRIANDFQVITGTGSRYEVQHYIKIDSVDSILIVNEEKKRG